MKRFFAAVVIAVALAVSAYAATEQQYRACTKDHVLAELDVVLVDDAKPAVVEHIGKVFSTVANSMPYDELVSGKGFQAFVDGLTDEDKDSFAVPGPPEAVGECKVAGLQAQK